MLVPKMMYCGLPPGTGAAGLYPTGMRERVTALGGIAYYLPHARHRVCVACCRYVWRSYDAELSEIPSPDAAPIADKQALDERYRYWRRHILMTIWLGYALFYFYAQKL